MAAESNETHDLPSALVVVLDLSPSGWEQSAQAGGPSAVDAAESLLTFVRAFFLLHAGNSVIVIATHPQGSEYLYQSPVHGTASQSAGTGALEMDTFDERLHSAIVALAMRLEQDEAAGAAEKSSGRARGVTQFSLAFAMAACACNRMSADKFRKTLPRVLVLSASTDLPAQYIPVMNCIFSFQKADVLVDSFVAAQGDCALLQQAADITGGVYLRPEFAAIGEKGGLLAWLMSCFLADQHTRYIVDAKSETKTTFLRLPRPQSVDYRASCFSTGQAIEIGFVCSVCLSIFSKVPDGLCPMCDSKIALGRPAGRRAGDTIALRPCALEPPAHHTSRVASMTAHRTELRPANKRLLLPPRRGAQEAKNDASKEGCQRRCGGSCVSAMILASPDRDCQR